MMQSSQSAIYIGRQICLGAELFPVSLAGAFSG
jgi:hypothetical protein